MQEETTATQVDVPRLVAARAGWLDARTRVDVPIGLPARIGRYHVVGRLGAGGATEVFLAELRGPSGLRQRFAIKRLRAAMRDDPDAIAVFARDAQIAARLGHRTIREVYELGADDDGPFMVQAHLPGATLSQVLVALRDRGCAMSLASAVRVVVDLCAALGAAHALRDEVGRPLGLVHREVSPANVRITDAGEVALVDLGAATLDPVQALHGARAKLGYLAPEQLLGERVDRRADLFAVGVILFEALTARRLFTRRDPGATTEAVLHLPIPDVRRVRADVPAAVVDVIGRALARDRDARYATADALRTALLAAVAPSAPARSPELAALAALVGRDPDEDATEIADVAWRTAMALAHDDEDTIDDEIGAGLAVPDLLPGPSIGDGACSASRPASAAAVIAAPPPIIAPPVPVAARAEPTARIAHPLHVATAPRAILGAHLLRPVLIAAALIAIAALGWAAR
jgi:serine/threonine-protein kinase